MITNLTGIIMTLGFMVSAAFFVVTYNLHKKQLGIGYWPIFSFAVLSFVVGEFLRSVFDNVAAFDYFFLVGMIMLAFAAILKFWEIMRLIE